MNANVLHPKYETNKTATLQLLLCEICVRCPIGGHSKQDES